MLKKIIEWFKKLFGIKESHNIDTENYAIEQDSLNIEDWEDVKEQQTDAVDDVAIVEEPVVKEEYKAAAMKYFTIEELCKSVTASIKKIDNTPSEEIKEHLTELIIYLLDPIREAWAEYCTKKGYAVKGITVNSGYRSPKLNSAVGGVKTSAHLGGYAADTKPSNGKQSEYEQFIREWVAKNPDVKFDYIIIEKSSTARWVHIAIKNLKGQQRHQCFNLVV
jgi:hypothetical protein